MLVQRIVYNYKMKSTKIDLILQIHIHFDISNLNKTIIYLYFDISLKGNKNNITFYSSLFYFFK